LTLSARRACEEETMNAAQQLQDLLGLCRPPVAVTFRDAVPPGVPRIAAAGPSSCTYWKLAAEGRCFYTEASDHYNCPVGAYTHGIDPTVEVKKELEGVISLMLGLGYLRGKEVSEIPRRAGEFGVAVYAPLAQTAEEPDVVILCGNAKQVMLLVEAAQAAGIGGGGLMGRPTCAALPEAMRSGRGVASLGCIGNRVYTELGDDELYFALPGSQVNGVTQKLASIVHANSELEKYHKGRKDKRAAVSSGAVGVR
jgi:uncharacterized protein (DUF169 family)